MGFLPLTKNLCLLLLVISASFLSISSAGRQHKFISTTSLTQESLGANEEASKNINENDEFYIHERLLRANTHDYGRYDASPSLPRPRHKLIPN
ncbi:protein CASPARIAN STRIP INTEGRITY FACTOR 1-like [Silene latifolia]|uniref:protein CASPARIAN STRIP INTEGRITY FACTOR 1-like n=1 Tax=Silene latifolia TaxID=37657 RepID=UPI003D76EB75